MSCWALILSVFVFISAVRLDPLPPFTCSYSAVVFYSLLFRQQQLWEKAELNKSSQPYQFSAGSCHDWTPVALPGRLCISVFVDVCVVALLWMCADLHGYKAHVTSMHESVCGGVRVQWHDCVWSG